LKDGRELREYRLIEKERQEKREETFQNIQRKRIPSIVTLKDHMRRESRRKGIMRKGK
jgi:hypothetical protein